MRVPPISVLVLCALGPLVSASPLAAAEAAFVYKTSYRNVATDPDHIWTGASLAPTAAGTVTIHEYELKSGNRDLLISQIWNDDCSSATCPTRLVQISPDGHRVVLVDDMMHQIVPPNDPRFASITVTKAQAEFTHHPFALSVDGNTLLNGDYRFNIDGGKR